MRLRKIAVKNFRLLSDVTLALEDATTVIVGRNNSGKTSMGELFRRLLGDTAPAFALEDFSMGVHQAFLDAARGAAQQGPADQALALLPKIDIALTFEYADDDPAMAQISEFIVDLDPNCREVLVEIQYRPKDDVLSTLFQNLTLGDPVTDSQRRLFFRALRERMRAHYESTIHAVDPGDPTNRQAVEWSALRRLLHGGFINAQRGLDDVTHKEVDVLAGVLHGLFDAAAAGGGSDVLRQLETAVSGIQQSIDGNVASLLTQLLPTIELFGYPGLSDHPLTTETVLRVEQLLTRHTVVRYASSPNVLLPESYNGLGSRNLIYILLRLVEFYKRFCSSAPAAGMHLVFIEEPEVHLHPQMQSVFIAKLSELARVFERRFSSGVWTVQFVVTTHSAHIANRAPLDALRYFLSKPRPNGQLGRSTQVKDLRAEPTGLAVPTREFLHRYLTVTRCDLLFADKIILLEGDSERLLLPAMVDECERTRTFAAPLSSQFVSVLQVDGSHAHLFFDFLDFLELPTLVVADLDCCRDDRTKCMASQATHTSNPCIRAWFPDEKLPPTTLHAKTEADRTVRTRRLAFQIPEAPEGVCGRSFEAAFMLANVGNYGLAGTPAAMEQAAWENADKLSDEKTAFAIGLLTGAQNWRTPKYIRDGLTWLAAQGRTPAAPAVAPGEAANLPHA